MTLNDFAKNANPSKNGDIYIKYNVFSCEMELASYCDCGNCKDEKPTLERVDGHKDALSYFLSSIWAMQIIETRSMRKGVFDYENN